jgi:hypothetical protein
MFDSSLHTVAIEELKDESPAFYNEYLILEEKISTILDSLESQRPKTTVRASLIQTYDVASREAVLQLIVAIAQQELHLHIYIHRDNKFIIGKSGSGLEARSANTALALIQAEVEKLAAQ